eukprot:GHRQ01007854.1.p2 GENE.GHRQ01007854.1~~GHRQ01007854.1.p2  ORF type:complete len:106 (-),score=19.10 GHRQ01007854.1:507-824(-)
MPNVAAMATHPPINTRSAPLMMLAPPRLAPTAPKPSSARVVAAATAMMRVCESGMKLPAASGMPAPRENASADVRLACSGLASSSMSMPSSSRACARSTSAAVSC